MQLKSPTVSISIVSHSQSDLVALILADIEKYCEGMLLEVLLTLNLPEMLTFNDSSYSFPVVVTANSKPRGFAENHNKAFAKAKGRCFCVMNPDIRLKENPFLPLISCLETAGIGVVAPVVLDEHGVLDDSARFFPSPIKILCKAVGGCKGSDYEVKKEVIYPDWVGGMFMLFLSETFRRLGGFNERYFLYYEDVDICARLRLNNYQVVLCPNAKVIHHAQRSSHRSFKYFRWHLTSMLRFFFSSEYRQLKCQKK